MTNKIVCVGRNYADHATELDNTVPSEPVLFMKPWDNMADLSKPINLAGIHETVHHEIEIVLQISESITSLARDVQIKTDYQLYIQRVGIGLDLTLRDLQTTLKNRGLPWERAKCFPNACPIAWSTMDIAQIQLNDLCLRLFKNGQLQQLGSVSQMLFTIPKLLTAIHNQFQLLPGDIIMTGTPSGVGPLYDQDVLCCQLLKAQTSDNPLLSIETVIQKAQEEKTSSKD